MASKDIQFTAGFLFFIQAHKSIGYYRNMIKRGIPSLPEEDVESLIRIGFTDRDLITDTWIAKVEMEESQQLNLNWITVPLSKEERLVTKR